MCIRDSFSIELLSILKRLGKKACFVIKNHNLTEDENKLLSKYGAVFTSSNRSDSIKLAHENGFDVAIMDDGFQNPAIHKDISILVIDGETGFGNGQIIPAGPLREPVAEGLSRADAALIIGNDAHGLSTSMEYSLSKNFKILRAHLTPVTSVEELKGKRVFAFAGIGRPKKFFHTLKTIGCLIIGTAEFPDHHAYTVDEINDLLTKANHMNATLVTTSKDQTRLDKTIAKKVTEIPVYLEWEDCSALEKLFEPILPDLS